VLQGKDTGKTKIDYMQYICAHGKQRKKQSFGLSDVTPVPTETTMASCFQDHGRVVTVNFGNFVANGRLFRGVHVRLRGEKVAQGRSISQLRVVVVLAKHSYSFPRVLDNRIELPKRNRN
jgi:hypothetical protein